MSGRFLLTGIGRLFTAGPLGVIEDAAVLIDGSRVAWVGRRGDRPIEGLRAGSPSSPSGRKPGRRRPEGRRADERPVSQRQVPDLPEVDLGGCLVTPGLVDAHTHPVYAGDRFPEIARRTAGATYAELARAGGGIGATVRATRAATPDALAALVRHRLAAWPRAGTTTVEAKTGYHLDREGELSAVGLLAACDAEPGLPRVEPTFLAAHAVPEGSTPDAQCRAAAAWCEEAASAGARHVDVFCDEGYFNPAQARTVLEAGRAAGLAPRVHADELARTGGAQLAAELRCAAADHLLRIDDRDCRALAAAGVTAVLCPATALAMGVLPPVPSLRAAGVDLALGTDHNPGTSGLTDMTVVIALAIAALGLSVDEALRAASAGGARSLRLPDRGVVATGLLADLVAWDAEHEGAFAWAWGLTPRRVWLGGSAVDAGGPDGVGNRT